MKAKNKQTNKQEDTTQKPVPIQTSEGWRAANGSAYSRISVIAFAAGTARGAGMFRCLFKERHLLIADGGVAPGEASRQYCQSQLAPFT